MCTGLKESLLTLYCLTKEKKSIIIIKKSKEKKKTKNGADKEVAGQCREICPVSGRKDRIETIICWYYLSRTE